MPRIVRPNVRIVGLQEVLEARGPEVYNRIVSRALGRASRELRALYLRELKTAIRERTRRRTGRLLRARVLRESGRRTKFEFLPDFPFTAYQTPLLRGRRNASKKGQYAFVVNSSRNFIEAADSNVASSEKLESILRKHFAFIISQLRKPS